MVAGLKCRDTFADVLLKIMKLCRVADLGDLVPENRNFGVGSVPFQFIFILNSEFFFLSALSDLSSLLCVHTYLSKLQRCCCMHQAKHDT